jgi:hypothetical protein
LRLSALGGSWAGWGRGAQSGSNPDVFCASWRLRSGWGKRSCGIRVPRGPLSLRWKDRPKPRQSRAVRF